MACHWPGLAYILRTHRLWARNAGTLVTWLLRQLPGCRSTAFQVGPGYIIQFTGTGGAASVGTSAPRHLQLVPGELRHHHPSHSTHTTHAPAKASRSSCARPSARRIDILHTTRPAHGSASRVTAIASSTSAQISSRRAGAASTCYPSGSARRTHADMPNLWASEKYGCSPPR